MAAYSVKAVEVDRLEAIMKNFYDFFLRKANKTESEALNLLEDLTYSIILISKPLGCLA